MMITLWIVAIGGYFLGAIPSGFLIAKYAKGIDIRRHGSGNPGAANVYRTCGKIPGFATAIGDILKGFLPVYLAVSIEPELTWFHLLVGALAIIGHNWTVFLGFKGGKGVATSAGVCVCLLPIPTLCATGAFLLGAALTNHISVGSMLAAVVLPATSLALGSPPSLAIMSVIIGAVILIRHISNMKRLLTGRELLFAKKT
ncbi:MAG: glycerol-3-phosphate 1-O-acyltransferase PlsY [Elusimicrobia bacterium]|nr:glycerol-3-phosphate 1-O-acyltransferase PlsY [Elusimicrobiota bacterium]